MIEDNTTWYLGRIDNGFSYKLAKYTDSTTNSLTSNTTTAKVGLLRLGELMSGQINSWASLTSYWLISPKNSSTVNVAESISRFHLGSSISEQISIKPSLNLKSNVVITGGLGTKEQPFEIALQ